MKYDFTSIMNRRGQDALAVDMVPFPGCELKEGYSVLPMWVADMNFPTCPSVLDSVKNRLDQPHFGYFEYPDGYFQAIQAWQKKRNGLDVPKDAIGYENGVLGGVASTLEAFTLPGEPVFLHAPAYIGFLHVLEDIGRPPVFSGLKLENGRWVMDYEDMEQKIRKHHIHTAIFCSPHNPTGRVWEREEIEKAMEIFRKYDVTVISDEIWSDLIRPGFRHIPTVSISEDAAARTAAFYAPSKTFSLAGLVGSYHIIPNPALRDRIRKAAASTHYNNGNVLSVHALMGAYTPEGEQWVQELMQVIDENLRILEEYFAKQVKGVRFGHPEGTYMLYLDFTQWLQDAGISMDELLKKGMEVGVIWQDGRPFQMENTIRLNTALPTSQVKEAVKRLDEHVFHPTEKESR